MFRLFAGGVSDNEESLAAKKTKQMIARTYGKRNRKKSKLRPVIHGTIWQGEGASSFDELHKQKLEQFSVSSLLKVFCHLAEVQELFSFSGKNTLRRPGTSQLVILIDNKFIQSWFYSSRFQFMFF